jgi:hypothetical protein
MTVKVKYVKRLVTEQLSTFLINSTNRHLYDKVDTINGPVFLRKNRLDTVVHVDIYGQITEINGKNPKKLKVGENIYKF